MKDKFLKWFYKWRALFIMIWIIAYLILWLTNKQFCQAHINVILPVYFIGIALWFVIGIISTLYKYDK